IGNNSYGFLVTPSDRSSPLRSRDHSQLEQKLRRIALNTHVDKISNEVNTLYQAVDRVIDELLKFNADNICLVPKYLWRKLINLPLLDHSRLFSLAQNVKDVSIGLICTSLTAQDFCALRKEMIDRSCEVEKFTVLVPHGLDKAVLDASFGVTFDD
ncbi:hypothetical protein PENTCL1PPCAC_4467, partial [Pristionchus entomophagus]